jgi:hypothetical protein
MFANPEQFVGFQAQCATRRAVFGAVLQVALAFLGKRASTMSGKGRRVAKELFKHSGLPYWGIPSAKSE